MHHGIKLKIWKSFIDTCIKHLYFNLRSFIKFFFIYVLDYHNSCFNLAIEYFCFFNPYACICIVYTVAAFLTQ